MITYMFLIAVLFGALLTSWLGWRIMYRNVRPSVAHVVTGRRATMNKETRKRLEEDRKRLIELADGDPDKLRRVPEVPDFKIVRSGGYLKQPGQAITTINRSMHHATIETTAFTAQGVPIDVQATVLYRVGDDELSIARYACRFHDEDVMVKAVEEVFEGKIREILATLSVHQILTERKTLGESVREACTEDFEFLGLNIENFTIKNVDDEHGYIKAIGAKDTAEVKKQARIAEAEAEREAAERVAEANALTAEAEANSDIKRAAAKAKAEQAAATAEQAGPLAQAKAEQDVIRQRTENEKLNAELEERRLQATVYKQADADKYAQVKAAEAEREAAVLRAEAESNAVRIQGLADAEATQARGLAEAETVKARGLAEAETVKALALGEAEGLKARGDALSANQEAILQQDLITKMPQIVQAAASSYDNVGQLTVLNGAEGLNQGVMSALGLGASAIPAVKAMFGAVRDQDNGDDNGGGNGAKREPRKPKGDDGGVPAAPSDKKSRLQSPADTVKLALDKKKASQNLENRFAELDMTEVQAEVNDAVASGRKAADSVLDSVEDGLDHVEELSERALRAKERAQRLGRRR